MKNLAELKGKQGKNSHNWQRMSQLLDSQGGQDTMCFTVSVGYANQCPQSRRPVV